MRCFVGRLSHQNKFFPVKFRSQSVLSLATCASLVNRYPCPCPLPGHLNHLHSHPLCCFPWILLLLLLPCRYRFLAVLSTVTTFVLRNTFVFISLQTTSMSNMITEWFIAITTSMMTYSTIIFIIVIHISALMQFVLKQKTPLNKV